MKETKELHLEVLNCVATDWCAFMESEQKEVVVEIKKRALNASRIPCFKHAFNLSMSKASSVSSVRNTIGTIKEFHSFNTSAKRNYVLLNEVKALLLSVWKTRWVKGTESWAQFLDQLQEKIEALEYISNQNETISASQT